ncbi:hypothetical protein JP75_07750 [Devosia riboflavina]|uniref:HTH cro/C1-type domain-containing protein n=2 Tax=Devosia riboflavina TaxID=46914 RepID=A0A087M3I6_9HYPH|nr:hypothetical protein JP75_07750 [Devosia riboflavina]
MTPEQFSAALNQNKLTLREFCRLTGTGVKTAERWLADEKDIPNWVPVTLALFTLPGALPMASAVAQKFAKEESNG